MPLAMLELSAGALFGGVYPYLDHEDQLGLLPDYVGRVWFVTEGGLVGTVDTSTSEVKTLALPRDERVANSMAMGTAGTAVVTDRALYLLHAGPLGEPAIVFRSAYARGDARKPGQLSQGSGSTPTFFGPRTGADYIAILDNARPAMNVLIYASNGGARLCDRASVAHGAGQ